MRLTHRIRRLLRGIGYDIRRFDVSSSHIVRRKTLIRSLGVTVALDVGANIGQFAVQLRDNFEFRGRIVSFEPLTAAFDELSARAASDPDWEVHHCALGAEHGHGEINVAENSQSSSILGMLPAHTEAEPASSFIGREHITIRPLDAVFDDVVAPDDVVYLKVDTQGFERQVLAGAAASLPRVTLVQLELSLTPLYAGETLLPEMLSLMQEEGYDLVGLEPGFTDPRSGRLLQTDGLFRRHTRSR